MTIDEAIKHCEEIAKDKTNLASTLWDSKEKARCEDCAEEHRQLVEWLKELKRQREAWEKVKAEIDQKQYDFMADKDYDEGIRFGLMLAYQIIDKFLEGVVE